jgi:3-hydroxyacyl-[acyl-carrier-protein] dehydratase
MLDINQIKGVIQHRYPLLLIDKVIEIEEGKRAVGMKNVSVKSKE